MSALTLAEHAQLARLAAGRGGRFLMARALRSRVLRWRYGAPSADALLLVPQEIRTADPSFANEHAQGLFGLGGAVAHIGDGSVFDLTPPSNAWARELHGFGWLRHLSAANDPAAHAAGRTAVQDWIRRYATSQDAVIWRTDVIGRRLISWIANADVLLDAIDADAYDRIMDSLGTQLIRLSASRLDSHPGYPRLVALIALMTGSFCISGHDNLAEKFESELTTELDRQLFSDGGHVSRDLTIVVDLLLDLLPLQSCFQSRDRLVPPGLAEAIAKMLRFVRFMRLGDGSLGRFNGMGATPFDSLATVLRYDSPTSGALSEAPDSRYARLARGDTVLLADIGTPPPLDHAGRATAGALSFELSIGPQAVFMNGGTPGPSETEWSAAARATASHNTLTLGARSSARLLENPLLSRLMGGRPLRNPTVVTGTIDHGGAEASLVAHHDGYAAPYGLLHHRKLVLREGGQRLDGEDRLSSATSSAMRLPRDIPFAVHFHVHPDVECRHGTEPGLVILKLPSGTLWYFQSEKATVSIEDSIHFADLVGPRKSQQIVLRGACFGDTVINWSFTEVTTT